MLSVRLPSPLSNLKGLSLVGWQFGEQQGADGTAIDFHGKQDAGHTVKQTKEEATKRRRCFRCIFNGWVLGNDGERKGPLSLGRDRAVIFLIAS